ncbi:MAG: hypothetical protein M9933_18740, partial [Chitinophagaceae bacterium]|nr:hypothetical protein [Chitinophagaceae bacterium]
MTSIKIFSWLSILLLFNISCNNTKNKDNINGNWEFVSITPTKSTSQSESAEVAANIWLNVLSSNSILKFQNDSLFLN